MSNPKIGVVVGSTRSGRFADKPARWIAEVAVAHGGLDVELVDLRDFPLPFFDESNSPGWAPSTTEAALQWQRKVASLDGYVVVTPEYNRGPSAALKNAFDYAYAGWHKKPIAFVGYGVVGGSRAVEQLRLYAIELQMAPTRTAVHIMWPDYLAVKNGANLSDFKHLNDSARQTIEQFAWWTGVLKTARNNDVAIE